MPNVLIALAALSLIAWIVLMTARGRFWLASERLEAHSAPDWRGPWPTVVAIVPARDEAQTIGRAVASLVGQAYDGDLRVIVVDDNSSDGTGDLARAAAEETGQDALTVDRAPPLTTGWTGKLAALRAGLARADLMAPDARFVLFTDADIEHHPGTLRALVAKAEAESRDMVSLMALLWHRGAWAGLLIPAFVFFFQKLYPFPIVNNPNRRLAAAAGGCVLLRRRALAESGGLEAIRHHLIDDCALARSIKHRERPAGGPTRFAPIWLGLTRSVRSIRPYEGIADVWSMVARTAFDQLHYSVVLLVGTVLGMALLYLVGPVVALCWPVHGSGAAAILGLASWGLMAVAFLPTLRLYRKPVLAAALLPVAGLLYSLMTIDSAMRHWRGAGGQWKGRSHSPAPGR